MKMKQLCVVLVLVTLLVAPSFLQAAQTCDRQCLVDLMKDYLAALVAHDPSAVPFDRYVKYTQNTAEIPVGYGLWETASGGPSEFQVYAADPINQQVAALVMMKENNNQDILLGVRLALRRGKISEVEHHVVKSNEINIQNLQKPRPALVEDIAPEDKTPRDKMLDIGLSYYDALTGEDGTLAPFAKECQRRENGGISVGGKKEDFPEPIDEQKGLAVGFSNLYHDSRLKTMKLYGIPGVDSVPAYQGTFNMPAIHFFKIKKGKIYDIEATGLVLPYGTKTGWE
jgi:hypothetical protein